MRVSRNPIDGSLSLRIAALSRAVVLSVGLAALAGTGCLTSSTLQASSESSSKASGSLSDSSAASSRSSSRDDERAAYHRDVRESAAGVAATREDVERLEREIGAIARQHAVLDWERDDETYRDIGRGLADAGVAPEQFDALADQLSHGDARRRALIEEGFAAARKR